MIGKATRIVTVVLLLFASVLSTSFAQKPKTSVDSLLTNALRTREFHLEPKTITQAGGRKVQDWYLCLNEYYVMISGQKRDIPIFPVYTESCFKRKESRAIDLLERVSNALDAMSLGEKLQVESPPDNGNFKGSSIWAVPNDANQYRSLVFRIDKDDVSRFGYNAQNATNVAKYVKDIFFVMRSLFVKHTFPPNSPAVKKYPYVKILERVWLDALQHAEKMRGVPSTKVKERVRREDIQEAIDMLSKLQRLRLLGVATRVPARVPAGR